MRCKSCDYPLWNLKARACPECGTAFRPSDHQFVGNSVRFCCPHCDQSYYGTDEHGHLVPASFECVTCGHSLCMDDMVLRPAEGVGEKQTLVDVMPWLERGRLGRWKGWLRTVGRSMVMPGRLMNAVPVQDGPGQAWIFMLLTVGIIVTCAIGGPLLGLSIILAVSGDSDSLDVLLLSLAFVVGGLAVAALVTALWGLATHGMLALTGGAPRTIGRTYQALCYAAGANITTSVPCIGFYPFVFIGLGWWVVSATIMVAAGHGISAGRAALATLAFPVAVLLLGSAGFLGAFFWGTTQARVAIQTAMAAQKQAETQLLLTALLAHASDAGGVWPAHALELTERLDVGSWDLVAQGTFTVEDRIPVGDVTLGSLSGLPAPERRRVIAAAGAALPPDVIAHRLGDFVFTYHGITANSIEAPLLWVVIMTPDPDTNEETTIDGSVVVGAYDGSTKSIAAVDFAESLVEQNMLRSQAGLAALPFPETVTHAAPARAP